MNNYVSLLEKSLYFPAYSRVILATISAHYVIVARQPKTTFVIMQMPKYWLMLLISAALAWTVLWYIEKINRKLNALISWDSSDWIFRVLLQAFYGVYIPLRLVVMVMASVFLLLDKDFEASGYMESEYFIVCWMIIVLNMLLALLYFVKGYFRIKFVYTHSLMKLKPTRKYLKYLDVTSKGGCYKIATSQIICIVKKDETGWVYTSDGGFYKTDKTMKWLLNMLDPAFFCQINRWTLINLKVVKGYSMYPHTRIVLHETFHEQLAGYDEFKANQKKTMEGDKTKPYEEDKLHISRIYFKDFLKRHDSFLNR